MTDCKLSIPFCDTDVQTAYLSSTQKTSPPKYTETHKQIHKDKSSINFFLPSVYPFSFVIFLNDTYTLHEK